MLFYLTLVIFSCLDFSSSLLNENGKLLVPYIPTSFQSGQSNSLTPQNNNNIRKISRNSSPSSELAFLESFFNLNPVSALFKLFYYGQYFAPGLLPIIFSVTNFIKSLQCWVSIAYSIFFISEWLRTRRYPFLPFALNFSDYYPKPFACLFLMVIEHLCVGGITYYFSVLAWSPDGPAWRQTYGFHQKATISIVEIVLGWDPSPLYAHFFAFSYAIFKYCGYIALEYKAKRNARKGGFPILSSLIRLEFIPLLLSRAANIISGVILFGLFIQFLYSILSTNEIFVFFAVFFHQNSRFSTVSTISMSLVLILIGIIAHFL